MKVYLAARFSRKDELNGYRKTLEHAGIPVTSRWLTGAHEFSGVEDHEIPVDRQNQFAREDVDDLLAADMFVTFTESPRAGPARGGRHVEFGIAYACGKPLVVIGYRENVFHCMNGVEFFPTWEEALPFLIEQAEPRI